jgi:uncharacterized protein YijF (DUF1287 family)
MLWLRLKMAPTPREVTIVAAARGCVGDIYDASSYPGGPPPRGRGACTDVVYWGYLPVVDLQKAVDQNRLAVGDLPREPDLDYRWCPRLIQWFQRHTVSLPSALTMGTLTTFRPGDVVFYADGDGGVGHVGIVSDRWSFDGKPLLIHNPGPRAVEENALTSNRIVGHFRLR